VGSSHNGPTRENGYNPELWLFAAHMSLPIREKQALFCQECVGENGIGGRATMD
jgi:hypothetical protein